MFRDRARVTGIGQQPRARGLRIGEGFLRGEGLGCDDEQRRGRVQVFECFDDLAAIDIGYKMHPQRRRTIGPQRLGDHQRAEIRPADTDVDHIPDGFAAEAFPRATAHPFAEDAHLSKNRIDRRHDVFAVDLNSTTGAVAQRNVQYRTIFTDVDLLAGEHAFGPRRHVTLACQVQQQRLCFRE